MRLLNVAPLASTCSVSRRPRLWWWGPVTHNQPETRSTAGLRPVHTSRLLLTAPKIQTGLFAAINSIQNSTRFRNRLITRSNFYLHLIYNTHKYVYNATENPFIICDSTGRNICSDIALLQKFEHGGGYCISWSFQFAHRHCFCVPEFPG